METYGKFCDAAFIHGQGDAKKVFRNAPQRFLTEPGIEPGLILSATWPLSHARCETEMLWNIKLTLAFYLSNVGRHKHPVDE